MTKVLFVDIDGVLNSSAYLDKMPDEEIDPLAVRLLNEATDRTGAKIVISSSWRGAGLSHMQALMKRCGVSAEVVDITPVLDGFRCDEIALWMGAHPKVTKFAILDDDDDMGYLKQYLVQTTPEEGLKLEHVERVVELLR